MKLYIRYIIIALLTLLLIVLATGAYFLPSIWISAAMVIAFIASIAVCYHFGLSSSLAQLSDKHNSNEQTAPSQLIEQDATHDVPPDCQRLKDEIGRWQDNPPSLTTDQTVTQCLSSLQTYLNDIGSRADVSNLLDRIKEMQDARELIELLQNRVTTPFQESLHEQSDVISKESSRSNLVLLLQSFMALYDAIDSFRSINARPEQSLNIGVIQQEMDVSEAMSRAIVATGDPVETPKWIRVLCDSLREWGITEEDDIVISGYTIRE